MSIGKSTHNKIIILNMGDLMIDTILIQLTFVASKQWMKSCGTYIQRNITWS